MVGSDINAGIKFSVKIINLTNGALKVYNMLSTFFKAIHNQKDL